MQLKDLRANLASDRLRNGSAFSADFVPIRDSTFVVHIKTVGMIISSKTNGSEFGLNTSIEPRLHGPTRIQEMWYSPGGSSGGAAAAVAAGFCPIGQASDGGLIRIPAACCDPFGLKPTRGRVALGPKIDEGWNGASVVHAITRSVRNSAATSVPLHRVRADCPLAFNWSDGVARKQPYSSLPGSSRRRGHGSINDRRRIMTNSRQIDRDQPPMAPHRRDAIYSAADKPTKVGNAFNL